MLITEALVCLVLIVVMLVILRSVPALGFKTPAVPSRDFSDSFAELIFVDLWNELTKEMLTTTKGSRKKLDFSGERGLTNRENDLCSSERVQRDTVCGAGLLNSSCALTFWICSACCLRAAVRA